MILYQISYKTGDSARNPVFLRCIIHSNECCHCFDLCLVLPYNY